MKAQFTNTNARNARNMANDKEVVDQMKLIARNARGELQVICDARFYMGRSRTASTVYCSLWVSNFGANVDISGHGRATGYGYHKRSAALQAALDSAGIELWGSPYDGEDENIDSPTTEGAAHQVSIDGCGDSAMVSALLAVAREARADCTEYLIV